VKLQNVRERRGGVGIYFCCGLDTRLDYIGQTLRRHQPNGIARRVLSHSATHRSRWRWIWVLPLHPEIPAEVMRAIESDFIARFRPPLNKLAGRPLSVPVFNSTLLVRSG
jgi:hypothetical protein